MFEEGIGVVEGVGVDGGGVPEVHGFCLDGAVFLFFFKCAVGGVVVFGEGDELVLLICIVLLEGFVVFECVLGDDDGGGLRLEDVCFGLCAGADDGA